MSDNENNVSLESLQKDNVTVRGKSLVTISVRNKKNEELSLNDVFNQIKDYIKDNKERIEDTVNLIGSYFCGPFLEYKKPFLYGYLYSKYIQKLEEDEKEKYSIEYTEKELSEDELNNLLADYLEKSAEESRKIAKKIRDGTINNSDLGMSRMML